MILSILEEDEELQERKKKKEARKNPTRKCVGRPRLVKILEEDTEEDSDGSYKSKAATTKSTRTEQQQQQSTRSLRPRKIEPKDDKDFDPNEDEEDDQAEYVPRTSTRRTRVFTETSSSTSIDSGGSTSSIQSSDVVAPVKTRYGLRARK